MTHPTPPPTTYRSGPGTALVGSRCALLLARADDTVVRTCWPLVDGGAEIGEIVEALARTGLASVGDFVLVRARTEGGPDAVVLVRGMAMATVLGPSAPPRTVDARAVSTWLETEISGPTVRLELGSPGTGPILPLSAGVVFADAVELTWTSASVALPVAEAVAAPMAAPVPESVGMEPIAEPAAEAQASPAEPVGDAPSGEGIPGGVGLPAAVGLAALDIPEQVGIADSTWPPEAGADPVQEAAEADTQSVAEAGTATEPEMMGPEAGFVQPVTADYAAPESEPVAEQPVAEQPVAEPEPTPGAAGSEEYLQDSGRETARILAGEFDEPPPYPVDQAPAPVDTDSANDLSNDAANDRGHGAAPSVTAVVCPYGHLSPPQSPLCRVCGTPIGAQDPVETARPRLGLLRLSTGDVIDLDRDVRLGRNPQPPEGESPGRTELVAVPSPNKDISRTHVEVRLDGWTVYVTDLGSTNGTLVTVPGQQPFRLNPNDPMPMSANTEVNLAGEVAFRFEVTG